MSLPQSEMLSESKHRNEQAIIKDKDKSIIVDEEDKNISCWVLKQFFESHTDPRLYESSMNLDHIAGIVPIMSDKNFQNLIDFMQNNKKVKKLKFVVAVQYGESRNFKSLCPDRMQKIAATLSTMPNLTHLTLGDYFLTRLCHQKCRSFFSGPCLLDILARNIKNCANLTHLGLSYMPLGISKKKHIESFADMIENCKNLVTLDLRDTYLNDMKESHFQILEKAIRENKSITSVFIETYKDHEKTENYRKRLNALLRSKINMTFVSGFHPSIGAGSALRTLYQSPIFDRKLVTLIFQFSGTGNAPLIDGTQGQETGNASFVEGTKIPMMPAQEIEESQQESSQAKKLEAESLELPKSGLVSKL